MLGAGTMNLYHTTKNACIPTDKPPFNQSLAASSLAYSFEVHEHVEEKQWELTPQHTFKLVPARLKHSSE